MDDDGQAFDVGVMVHVRGRDEPFKIMAGMYAPLDPEMRDPHLITGTIEEAIIDDWRNSSMGWIRFESHNGDVAHVHKDDIQMLKIIKPKDDQ